LSASEIASWSNYLAAVAEVAATLTGLVFVAVSINLSRVISLPGLVGRAAESLMQLFAVVIISINALIPGQSSLALGMKVLGLGSLLWIVETVMQIRYMQTKPTRWRRWVFLRIAQTQFANIPFCVCGILLIRGSTGALYWLPTGFVFSLLAGVIGAWVLLVEILR
jgi:hypothetical protein